LLRAARVLELEDPRTALLEQDGALAHEVRLAGRERLGRLVVEAVGHELDDTEQAGLAAVRERGPHELRGIAVQVLAIGAQEDNDLGGRGAESARARRAEPVDQTRSAQAVDD